MYHDRFPGSFFGPPTLVDLLRHRAAHQPNDTAYIFLVDGDSHEVSLTYAELDRQARAIAAWLESFNLRGQRALLLYPAGLEFIATFFGCLYAGVVAVPAYPPRMNRSLDRIQAIAADADARIALTTQPVLERVQPLLEQTPDLKQLQWLATDQVPAGLEFTWRAPDVHGDTVAFLQYTSGSTGLPKGVVLSHSNLLHNSALIAYAFENTRSSSGAFWLPSYHDMGLVGGVLQPMYFGRPNVLMSPMSFLQRPFRWLQAITRYKTTISGGPNFAYDLCIRKITPEQRAKLDLSHWQLAFNGAEPVRAETIDQFCETFGPCGFRREAFYPCYGMAEASLLVTGGFRALPPVFGHYDAKQLEGGTAQRAAQGAGDARALVGSGQQLPDQKVLIVDPETHLPLPPRKIGEIWVQGPSVAMGYWQRPEETEHTFRARRADTGDGPYLRTGDLGFFDGPELFVTGRLKDLIIIHGLNHYPQDIELTVEKSHPALRPGAGAAFVLDEESDPKLVVVVEVERRRQTEAASIVPAIRRDVSREHELQVHTILLLRAGSIPKTSSGKIQRRACRDAFLQHSLEVVARWSVTGDEWMLPASSEAVTDAVEPSANGVEKLAIVDYRATDTDTLCASPGMAELEPIPPAPRSAETPPNGQPTVEARPFGSAGDKAIVEIVLEAVQRVGKERTVGITADTNLLELGLDSIERMEILASLEDHFGGRFPEEILPNLETARDVARAIDQHLGRPASSECEKKSLADIPAEHYQVEKFPEYVKLRHNLEMLDTSGLGNPYFAIHQRVTRDTTVIGDRELINFSSYNYVGMSGDPRVIEAAKAAIDRYGTSVSASRLVSGEKALHRELEQAIAQFVGVDDAIVYVGGHSTNETTIGHLFGPGDLILHDALAHNSIIQGCILSGARRRPFPHNDWRAVDQLLTELRTEYRRVLVAIEGVYSMDGDIPDLPKFIEVKKRHKALLMVDEAHSAGVLGKHGRGIGEYFDVPRADVDLWMGTLSKSYGSCGGYIAGSQALVEYLKYTSPGFVFSVGISPPNAAAALESIRVLQSEPERVARLHQRAKLFLQLARQRRLNTGLSKDSPVVPVILGNSVHCLQLSRALFARGINVQPILYPAVEERASRLRFFITSDHTEQQIRFTVDAVAEELAKINPRYQLSPRGEAAEVPVANR